MILVDRSNRGFSPGGSACGYGGGSLNFFSYVNCGPPPCDVTPSTLPEVYIDINGHVGVLTSKGDAAGHLSNLNILS